MGQPVRTTGETEVKVQQIKNVWAGLDRRQQFIAIFASVAVFAGILMMSRIASQPTMQLLYSGLENGTAGEVVTALEQRGVIYEVRGGAIYTEARSRDELRMTLAAEGLPANGSRGYELLDSLTGFGTTSQMFDAAYWRAKEGELARTIVASPHIGQARVHISNTSSNPFQRSSEPTASVSISSNNGQISVQQAKALRFLVASAVAGLSVENVAIIGSNGSLIGNDDKPASADTANTRSDLLRDRVQRMVEARVGAGNAIVEVSVETVTQTETIKERRLDPSGRVAISTDTEERSDNSSNRISDVSVASNLPDGDAATGDDATAQATETRERVNYEISQTEYEILRQPGDIKRLTVAVLVNGLPALDPAEPEFTPRPDVELDALRDLVASAVGFEESRGDVITIKSMNLQVIEPMGTSVDTSFLAGIHIDAMAIIQMLILGVVTLLLGLFVVRPLISRAPAPPLPAVQSLPARAPDTVGNAGVEPVLTGEIDDGTQAYSESTAAAIGHQSSGSAASLTDDRQDDSVERLRAMIGDRQEETVEILRSWLEEQKEGA